MDERWLPVDGFPRYFVSNFGRARGPLKILKPGVDSSGYLHIRPCLDGKCRTKLLSRLVCTAFHGTAPSPDHEAAHLDGDKTNNAASNLAWSTPKQNQAHKYHHGTVALGENSGKCKLSDAQVATIRARRVMGHPVKGIAREFGIWPQYVYTLCARKARWTRTPPKRSVVVRSEMVR